MGPSLQTPRLKPERGLPLSQYLVKSKKVDHLWIHFLSGKNVVIVMNYMWHQDLLFHNPCLSLQYCRTTTQTTNTMTQRTTVEIYSGKLCKIQTLNYSDGMISKRIFNKPDDVVPFDIIWLRSSVKTIKQLIFCCE